MTDSKPANLAEENERLRAEMAVLVHERDVYRTAYIHEIERGGPGFTKEEFENGVPTGPWFDEFLQRIRDGDPDPGKCFPWRVNA